jgi:hypothetical protein
MTNITHNLIERVTPRRLLLATLLALTSALAVGFMVAPAAQAAGRNYHICVTTGSAFGAGTDSNVEVQLSGILGTTGFMLLDDWRNNFEWNTTDCFDVFNIDVGRVRQVNVRSSGDGSWYLSKIKVNAQEPCPYFNWVWDPVLPLLCP